MTKGATVYDVNGFVEDLPNMNFARTHHGCGHYINSDNNLVRKNVALIVFYILYLGLPGNRRQ